MIVIALAVIGIILGYRTATKRQGNRLDVLQYVAGYCIAFTVLGVLLTVILEKILS